MFVVVGLVGVLLLVTTLVLDDVIDEVVPGVDFLSGPVLGAFLAAFGLVGWFVDDGVDAGVVLAIVLAITGGAVFGAGTFWLTRVLMNQPTDATPTTASLVGHGARVVTPIRAGGLGEVVVRLGGTTTKYTATADEDLPSGADTVVVQVESPTKVRVESAPRFWS